MSDLSDTELLANSCLDASNFPRNIIRHYTPQHHLDAYFSRLDRQAPDLFCEDGKAALDIWEYDDVVKEFQLTCASSRFELNGRLQGKYLYSHDDPRCRFLFFHARHSRDRLRTSREMLVAALTHHQVMPSFLDFIFPFGVQEYLQDFYFSGLREETRLQSPGEGLFLPKLGRSGREIRMCYNLKSVEVSKNNPEWPWSIRQTAVYHSFDVETGKSFWVTVKGNQLIRDRIQAATKKGSTGSPSLKSFESIAKAFASTLATHLVLCDWCDEEWRWYLNYLEKRLQQATGRSLAIIIDKEPSLFDEPLHRNVKPASPSSLLRTVRTVSNFTKRTLSTTSRLTRQSSDLEKVPYAAPFPFPPTTPTSPPPPPGPLPPPKIPAGMPGSVPNEKQAEEDEDFTFKNLQMVQHFEEKANEVAPVLEANIDILTELKEHYRSILNSEDCPDELKAGCRKEFAEFEKRINTIVIDLQRQCSRTKLLQRLLSDRKGLLYGILNKRAIETSKTLAKKGQLSADRMEVMTDAMYELAKKTQQETVSMKIITLVTLFFLPGTFISWHYVKTIMSTDILTFPNGAKNFEWEALQMYLEITVPFMAATFAAWYGMYLLAKWKEAKKERQIQNSGSVSSMV